MELGGNFQRYILGIALLVWAALTASISWQFTAATDRVHQPVISYVILQFLAGMAYLLLIRSLARSSPMRGTSILLFGLLLRLPFFISTPILEDDYYRYLWDGAVASAGLNPYEHSPDTVKADTPALDSRYHALARQNPDVLKNINHPWLRTIYPPVAQAAFFMSHRIQPWSLSGLRLVWLCFDLGIVMLLLWSFREHAMRSFHVGIYWLNPLLIKEVYNSGHMELVVVAFAMAAVVLTARHRRWLAITALALATGAKIWPVLLLPILLRHTCYSVWEAAKAFLFYSLLCVLILSPVLADGLGGQSGFTAYTERWQMNDSAYLILYGMFSPLGRENAQAIARIVVVCLLLGLLWRTTRKPYQNNENFYQSVLIVIAALFLLSPTQFPWYYIWVIPWLSLSPSYSLLLLTLTLPLYYFRFPLEAISKAHLFDYGIVWLEFVPVWILLLREFWRTRKQQVAATLGVPA